MYPRGSIVSRQLWSTYFVKRVNECIICTICKHRCVSGCFHMHRFNPELVCFTPRKPWIGLETEFTHVRTKRSVWKPTKHAMNSWLQANIYIFCRCELFNWPVSHILSWQRCGAAGCDVLWIYNWYDTQMTFILCLDLCFPFIFLWKLSTLY